MGKIQLTVLKQKIVGSPIYQHLVVHIDTILKEKQLFNSKSCNIIIDGAREVESTPLSGSFTNEKKKIFKETKYNLENMQGFCFIDSESSDEILKRYDNIIDKNSLKQMNNLVEKDKGRPNFTVFKLLNNLDTSQFQKTCKKPIINLENGLRFLKALCDLENGNIIIKNISVVVFNATNNVFEEDNSEKNEKDLNDKLFHITYNESKSIYKDTTLFNTNNYRFVFNNCNNVEKYSMQIFDFSLGDYGIDKIVMKHFIELIDNKEEKDVNKLLNLTINESEERRQKANSRLQEYNFTYSGLIATQKANQIKCDDDEDKVKCLKLINKDVDYQVKMSDITRVELEEIKQSSDELRRQCVDTKLFIMNHLLTLEKINMFAKNKPISYEKYCNTVSNDDCIYIHF